MPTKRWPRIEAELLITHQLLIDTEEERSRAAWTIEGSTESKSKHEPGRNWATQAPVTSWTLYSHAPLSHLLPRAGPAPNIIIDLHRDGTM